MTIDPKYFQMLAEDERVLHDARRNVVERHLILILYEIILKRRRIAVQALLGSKWPTSA